MSFGMVIGHNLGSMNALSALNQNSTSLQSALQKLSTGKRINGAADDAAGLAISQKMQSQINGLDQANRNAQDGISLIQTAEGALNETQSILQRMRTLSVQASNDTNTTDDRNAMQLEVNQLSQEIDRIGNTTQFNTKNLLDGGAGLATTVNSETVAGVNTNFVSIVGATSATQTGTLNVTAATAATGATQTFTVAATAGSQSITLNGQTLSYTATGTAATDAQTLANLVNSNSSKLGITAKVSGSSLTFTTSDVGSASSLTVNAAAGALTAAAVSNVKTSGSDATITDSTIGSNYIASGNLITVTSGSFAGMQLQLNGSAMSSTGTQNLANISITGNGSLTFQIGANQGQTMSVSIQDMRSAALGVNNIDLTSQANAETAMTTIDNAIKVVSNERANLGAYQNRLEHTINNLQTSSDNLTTAESGITDTNMAQTMAEFTKDNVLQQAAVSMLAQANQQPQMVLKLLG